MPSHDKQKIIRAVAATEFWYGATGLDIVDGLRRCNWDVQQVNIRNFFNMGSGFLRRASGRLISPAAHRYYNLAIRRAIKETDARVLFTVKGNQINQSTLQWCATRRVLKVIFYPDVAFNHDGVDATMFRDFDLITTTKSYHLDYMLNHAAADAVHHISHGYSSLIYRDTPPVEEQSYRWDVAYVGNASIHKSKFLLEVKRLLPDLRMIVIGAGWDKLSEGTALAGDVLGYGLTGDHYAAVTRLSRINVAVHFGVTNALGWEDVVSRRTFEIPAYGGFMLHIDNAEVRALYDVPAEIDVFATPSELVEKIRYYLPRAGQRAAMIGRARLRSVPDYGYNHRAKQLDAIVRNHISE